MMMISFLLVFGFGLIMIGCLAFVFLFGFWIAYMKNLHDLSDIKQTSPELYAEVKAKFQSRFPQFAEPSHMKGDFAWRHFLSEENISQLERADELRSHPVFIKRQKIIKRLKTCLIIVITGFAVGGSIFTGTLIYKEKAKLKKDTAAIQNAVNGA